MDRSKKTRVQKPVRLVPRLPMYFDPDLGRTKQSFKDECNINKIMARFQKTGAIDHYMTYSPQYGDTTACGLHEAMNIVANAETMFEELPSSLRKKFHNDPAEFLEFVQDEKNLEEMRELGLAKKVAMTRDEQNDARTAATSKSEPASTEGSSEPEK